MAEFLINPTEIPYIIMGGYSRLSDMFGEYRVDYGFNKRKDTDRENAMLILYVYVMAARHNSTGLELNAQYQQVINKLYTQYSLNQYLPPIINGI